MSHIFQGRNQVDRRNPFDGDSQGNPKLPIHCVTFNLSRLIPWFPFEQSGSIPLDRVRACTDRLKPAQQRGVGSILAKLARALSAGSHGEKENVPGAERAPEHAQQRTTKTSARGGGKAERHAPSTPRIADEPKHNTPGHHHRSPRSEAPVHPLIASSGTRNFEKSRASLRTLVWPEYPEEPLGDELFLQLKKAWSPVLPSTTVTAIFPIGGIRKQDDGTTGCECLKKAILFERAGDGVAIEEQLELIFRWITVVLCSKEHTVGLQALLTTTTELFAYLRDIKYEVSDSEAMLLIPFVLEKASLAKGRFRELFDELVVQMKVEEVIPMKRLGSVVAVSMLERASHAKARWAACQDCSRCVEQLGLSGIGKKGVLVAAKALSEETLSENRTACLDLMELVLSRMNGDVQRLARICGSFLSDKARRLVDERCQRRKTNGIPSKQSEDVTSRRSRIPTPQKATPTPVERPTSRLSPGIPAPGATLSGLGTSSGTELQDELPALVLRHKATASPAHEGTRGLSANGSNTNHLTRINASTDCMSFSYSSSSILTDHESKPSRLFTPSLPPISSQPPPTLNLPSLRMNAPRESVGAAADLRARLMKIREKSKNPSEITLSVQPSATVNAEATARTPHAESVTRESLEALSILPSSNQIDGSEYQSGMTAIDELLRAATPLPEGSKILDDGIECMKRFHAALSKQQNVGVGLTSENLSVLRQSIIHNVDEIIERLARYVSYLIEGLSGSWILTLLFPLLV
jgi:hypothetical protein